jgi:hypothetical protein
MTPPAWMVLFTRIGVLPSSGDGAPAGIAGAEHGDGSVADADAARLDGALHAHRSSPVIGGWCARGHRGRGKLGTAQSPTRTPPAWIVLFTRMEGSPVGGGWDAPRGSRSAETAQSPMRTPSPMRMPPARMVLVTRMGMLPQGRWGDAVGRALSGRGPLDGRGAEGALDACYSRRQPGVPARGEGKRNGGRKGVVDRPFHNG